ncbi:MAG: fumarylacetoacetate hydrolase family protein [Myxococcales bacterium]|nr:fumarylacetoacetate hydrolase family protein [Myxococcales bacterium]
MRVARLARGSERFYAELSGGRAWVLTGAPWHGGVRTGERIEEVDALGRGLGLTRLCPVEPSKIVGIGRNYRAHAEELGNEVPEEPLLFLKPPSSLIGPDGTIVLPPSSERVEHEAELGLVIGERLTRASEDTCLDAIWGLTIVGDITARDLQRRDKTWTRGKGHDTFCPVGPVVVQGLSDADLTIRCTVNGEERQLGHTRDMVFRPAALLVAISEVMTLEPGDVIATGTPEGVGPLVAGDRLVIEIAGIGALSLSVERRA